MPDFVIVSRKKRGGAIAILKIDSKIGRTPLRTVVPKASQLVFLWLSKLAYGGNRVFARYLDNCVAWAEFLLVRMGEKLRFLLFPLPSFPCLSPYCPHRVALKR